MKEVALYHVKQLNNIYQTNTVTSLYSHLHHTRTPLTPSLHCYRPLSAANVFPFKSPLLHITNGPQYTLTDKLTTHGHETSVTEASNPKKQLY